MFQRNPYNNLFLFNRIIKQIQIRFNIKDEVSLIIIRSCV